MTVTNSPLDSIFHPHVPDEVPADEVTYVNSTEAVQPSTPTPTADPSKFLDEASKKSATADDFTKAFHASSTPSTANPSKFVDEASKKSATADDFTKAFHASSTPSTANPSKFVDEASKKSATADDFTKAFHASSTPPAANLSKVVDEASKKSATADDFIKAFHASSSTPATDPSKLLDEASNTAATADDSTESLQPSSSTPAANLSQNNDHTPSKSTYPAAVKITNAKAFPEGPDPEQYNTFNTKHRFTAQNAVSFRKAAGNNLYSKLRTSLVARQSQPSEHDSTDISQPTPVLDEAACHAETNGEPHLRASNWKFEDSMTWRLSEPLETHFNEICPVNLLGDKCKCPLPKVNRKVSSLLITERSNTADCE